MSVDHLFSPVSIGKLTWAHRGIMPSMVTNLCGTDGSVTDRFIAYHVARARGGVALNITEAASVHRLGKGFPNQLGIDDDALVPGLRRLTTAVHAAGGRIGIQLYHGGRQANVMVTGGTVVAPSPIPCPVVQAMPHELTVAEIAELVQVFVRAGQRAQQAGFDAIEVHGAHGYLINEFLSPHTNHREDEYGRDKAGRARFPLEIVDGLRAALGADPVSCAALDEFGCCVSGANSGDRNDRPRGLGKPGPRPRRRQNPARRAAGGCARACSGWWACR